MKGVRCALCPGCMTSYGYIKHKDRRFQTDGRQGKAGALPLIGASRESYGAGAVHGLMSSAVLCAMALRLRSCCTRNANAPPLCSAPRHSTLLDSLCYIAPGPPQPSTLASRTPNAAPAYTRYTPAVQPPALKRPRARPRPSELT